MIQRHRIEELKAQGRTIIYTTHYMEEAQRLCDRVGIIDAGKILALDSVDVLLKQHGGNSIVQAILKQSPPDESVLPNPLEPGNTLKFASPDPLKQILELSHAGIDIETLEIKQPDLECVFLNLTGRSLRDD